MSKQTKEMIRYIVFLIAVVVATVMAAIIVSGYVASSPSVADTPNEFCQPRWPDYETKVVITKMRLETQYNCLVKIDGNFVPEDRIFFRAN